MTLKENEMSIETYAFQSIVEIETKYDSADRMALECISNNKELSDVVRNLSALYILLWDRQINQLYSKAADLFRKIESKVIKASILQVAIAATEVQFDLAERKKWFRLWYTIRDIEQSFYCHYLYLCHRANSLYFDGNRTDAIKLWSQGLELCRTNHYERGQFRLLFFMGRAYQELNYYGEAEFYYHEAYKLAQSKNAHRFIERIKVNLESLLNKNYTFNSIQTEVLKLIERGQLKKAKKLTLYTCRCRRHEGRSWGAESEFILLAWISFSENKMKRFFTILDHIDDEYMKLLTIHSLPKINKIRFESNSQLRQIQLLILKQIDIRSLNPKNQLPINEVESQSDVEKLIHLLRESEDNGLTMEAVCLKMWNLDYQPEVHAHRVYLLITKVRKYFGSAKSVLNTYGGIYKINPLLGVRR